ncbi:DUF2202 domain-containing protein [Candidatus Saccharibacteria bacterium]|nr:DUF2202 domain-containing protein [Candidatus Saccharibacteria bacterium]
MEKKFAIAIITVLSLALIGLGIYTFNNSDNDEMMNDDSAMIVEDVSIPPTQQDDTAVKSNFDSQERQLLYLIEEEKLAHDVYTVLYEKYGARVFGSILNSESTHQGKVLTLLEARNIKDPRIDQIGKFQNTDLQQLYDELIAKGLTGEMDAYQVGVAIEERDIKDISNQLATTTEPDIIYALESLRSGSENHLRAFNRQISRY